MADAVNNTGNVLDRITDSRTRLADSTETFLALLTTQLKNQDPLSPMDSSQFTQQIVQMTGVEQQLLTNDLLAALVGMSDGGLTGSVDLIGKTVTAQTGAANLADGKAEWKYTLPSDAAKMKVEIIDTTGKTVKTVDLTDVTAGDKTFTWDGKDQLGNTLQDGAYGIRFTGTDIAGAAVNPAVTLTGTVTGVQSVNGTIVVTIGGVKIPVTAITAVENAA
jgi:flagellar basal-body rod modification protein FlgD